MYKILMNLKKLNAAIIGLGVGERHIDGYQSDERCTVTKLCDIDEKKLNEVGKIEAHRAAHAYLLNWINQSNQGVS
jgi:predicted dehydrogenase